MAITHNLNLTWSGSSGGISLTKLVALSAAGEDNREEIIPASTTANAVPLAFTKTLLQSFFLLSDQDLTFKTNSSGSPQDTLTIKTNKPFIWYKGSGIPCPFANNVSASFFDNATLVDANLSIRVLTDG